MAEPTLLLPGCPKFVLTLSQQCLALHPPTHPPTHSTRSHTHTHTLQTPEAIWQRMKSGNTQDLKEVLAKWTKNELWVPPKQDQAFQQVGREGARAE